MCRFIESNEINLMLIRLDGHDQININKVVRVMSDNMKEIIDKALKDLDKLVKAKAEETVKTLRKEIEEAIKNTGRELTKKCKLKKED